MREITYKRKALKAMMKLPTNERTRVRSKIEQYASEPESLANNVTKLKSRDGVRLRIGDWRVIMDDDGAVLDVLDVGPRGGIYD